MRHWWFRGLALTFALSVLGWHVVTAAGCEKQSPQSQTAPYLPVRMMMPPKPGETPQQGATPSATAANAVETASAKKPCKPAYFPATKAAPVFHDDEVPCVDEPPAAGNTQGVAKPGSAK